jgi:hypothetical protein
VSDRSEVITASVRHAHFVLVVVSLATAVVAISEAQSPRYARALRIMRLVQDANFPSYDAHVIGTVERERARLEAFMQPIAHEFVPDHDVVIDTTALVTATVTEMDSYLLALPAVWAADDLYLRVRQVHEESLRRVFREICLASAAGQKCNNLQRITFRYDEYPDEALRAVGHLKRRETVIKLEAPARLSFMEQRTSLLNSWLTTSDPRRQLGLYMSYEEMPAELIAVFPEIAGMSLENAVHHLEERGVRPRQSQVWGIDVTAVATTTTFSLITIAILLYLGANLSEARRLGVGGGWIGFYDNAVSRVLTAVSICVLPFVTTVGHLAATVYQRGGFAEQPPHPKYFLQLAPAVFVAAASVYAGAMWRRSSIVRSRKTGRLGKRRSRV